MWRLLCRLLISQLSRLWTSLVFEETIEDKTIQSLVYVELKVRQIRESSRWLSESSLLFRSIPELLSNYENVLAHADQYPKELNWPLTYDKALKIELNERPLRWLMLDIFLCIETNDGTDAANFLPNNGGNVPNSDDYGGICIA
ncbi:hypothetical protein DdX_21693 [Ditylenchus destructor]|uniref:Uncharacterized protein n=1 Tax=Ditylenchus destructor TaxID=166010 RepID=A0AAD4MJ95_9BILA|nr:hypothetical protein DdX_21693 [Ditylenchus destructor]